MAAQVVSADVMRSHGAQLAAQFCLADELNVKDTVLRQVAAHEFDDFFRAVSGIGSPDDVALVTSFRDLTANLRSNGERSIHRSTASVSLDDIYWGRSGGEYEMPRKDSFSIHGDFVVTEVEYWEAVCDANDADGYGHGASAALTSTHARATDDDADGYFCGYDDDDDDDRRTWQSVSPSTSVGSMPRTSADEAPVASSSAAIDGRKVAALRTIAADEPPAVAAQLFRSNSGDYWDQMAEYGE